MADRWARHGSPSGAPELARSPDARTATVWLTWALGLVLGIAALTTVGLVFTGESVWKSLRATAPGHAFDVYCCRYPGVDSLEPMVTAYSRKVTEPTTGMYSVFFVDRVKFQYPPMSLLILDLLPRSWTIADGKVTRPLRRYWTVLIGLCVLVTLLGTAAILDRQVARPARGSGRPRLLAVGLSLGLGGLFYPLVKGYELGQVQVLLGCLATLALLSQVSGRVDLTAALLAVCALVKPQWGVILLWALARRRWRFAAVFSSVLLLGTLISIARFGLDDHLRYLDVLRVIGATGEAYWPNQSVNGLLNRLRGNGDAVNWAPHVFPSPDPMVQALTLLTSCALLGIALWPGRPATLTVDDLPLAIVAATMASPIAWEQHYGLFLAVFALVLPAMIRERPLGRATAPVLAFAYVAISSVILRPDLLFANRALGIIGSNTFLGGLALFALLVGLRTVERRATIAP